MKRFFSAILVVAIGLSTNPCRAQTVAAPYDANYTLTTLGTPTGVPANLGGLTFLAGDPNTLLISGGANGSSGAIYSIGVTRNIQNHISGFSGTATLFATAPDNDGGLAYGPGGVLFFTQYSDNTISEIKPGSTSPDKTVDLSALGVSSSVGSLQFIPNGSPGAGSFVIGSYSGGGFYSAPLASDGSGTYDIGAATLLSQPNGGPEGIAYPSTSSPNFATPSLLLSEYSNGAIGAYSLNPDGSPNVASRQDFITGLSGAEGAAIDPVTGDFLFSTFGSGNTVEIVSGFAPPAPPVPEPSSLVLMGLGGLIVAGLRARRRRS